MESNQNNIDKLFRDKFKEFAPQPPEKIWAGIESGLAAPVATSFFGQYGKQIAAAVFVLIVLAGAIWYFYPVDDYTETAGGVETNVPMDTDNINSLESSAIADTEIDATASKEDITDIDQENSESALNTEKVRDAEIHQEYPVSESTAETSPTGTYQEIPVILPSTSNITNTSLGFMISKNVSLETKNDQPSLMESKVSLEEVNMAETTRPDMYQKKGAWSTGIYFSPEFILNDFDSVELLPTYSFSIEPTYYSNNNWFVRTGLGLSYARDRGFAKVDFISNDLMGSYDDVYNVTFDTINGQLVPTYYSESVEVWDSIPHIAISQITNSYFYLQLPVLFGYHNDKSKKLRWYFYGGPAINFKVSENIEEPSAGFENVDIVDVENRLPLRSAYYMQLWLGGGIELNASKNLSIALEPNYRYYFNNVFKEDTYKTSLSGFSFRIGLVYSFK